MIRLHGRKAHGHGPDDKIIPLINVIFLLLMFFLIAGTLSQMAVRDFRPPRSQSEARGVFEQPVLLIAADGVLFWDDEAVDAARIVELLGARGMPKRLRLHVDARAKASMLLPVIDELRRAGVTGIGIVTQYREAAQ